MPATIEVEGKRYSVVDFIDQGGMKVRIVDTPEGERVAVKRGVWTWWTVRDGLGLSGGVCTSNKEE